MSKHLVGDIVMIPTDARQWRIIAIFLDVALIEVIGEAWVREREVPLSCLVPVRTGFTDEAHDQGA